MRIILSLVILFFLFSPNTFGQERLFFQSDSLYKANKVKKIKLFNMDRLRATIFFDENGKLIKYKGAPVSSGWQKTEYYEYDDLGKLIKRFDIIRDKRKKILKYKIEYSNNEVLKLIKYNSDASLMEIKLFENNGKKQIWKTYKNGEIISELTTELIDNLYIKERYGWSITRNSKKYSRTTYEYIYRNGQIEKFIRYYNGEKRLTTKIEYHNNNLIKNLKYNGFIERYKYSYYK